MRLMVADGLIERETVLGSFYEKDEPGFEEGTGLVPA